MSDMIPTQHESAVAVLRERERGLDAERQTLARQIEKIEERQDELLNMIATLTRKPRVRRPRAVTETAPANDADDAPRSSVFATPAAETCEEAA